MDFLAKHTKAFSFAAIALGLIMSAAGAHEGQTPAQAAAGTYDDNVEDGIASIPQEAFIRSPQKGAVLVCLDPGKAPGCNMVLPNAYVRLRINPKATVTRLELQCWQAAQRVEFYADGLARFKILGCQQQLNIYYRINE